MSFEKRWGDIAPRLFIANGASNGQIQLADTILFKVKQKVAISATGLPNLELEVKAVLSDTILIVGPLNGNINTRTNMSAYTVAAGAFIYAAEQIRSEIPPAEHQRATFEEEPTNARRSVLVDPYGNFYTPENPIPTGIEIVLDDVVINVKLDAFSSTPDSTLSVGSEDGTTTGTRHVVKVGSDLNLRVKDEEAISVLNEIDSSIDATNLHLADIEVSLDNANLSLDSIELKLDEVNGNLEDANTSLDSIETKLDAANTSLDSIENKLDAVNLNLDAVNTNLEAIEDTAIEIEANTSETNNQLVMANATLDAIELALNNPLQITQPVITAGTQNGSPTGPQFVHVNNLRQQILASHDREQDITYADFGTKDQRITQVDYNSTTFPANTARKTITYTLISGRYRRDSINWSLV